MARSDLKLAVGAVEMICHRLRSDEQVLRDLPVRLPFSSKPGDAKLAGSERVYALKTGATRTGARRYGFSLHPFYQGNGATASCDIERFPERLPRLHSVTLAPKLTTEVCQGACPIELRRRFLQHLDCRTEQVDPIGLIESGQGAEGNADRSRDARTVGIGEVILRELTGFVRAFPGQHCGER